MSQHLATVSTIIPSYNCAPYIGAAIRCALEQKGVESEVIVIDDGSTDGTGAILDTFGSRVRRLETQRVGPYRARNLGARAAHGEWLAFLDADDEWLPNKLERQLAIVDANTDLVYTDRINFGENCPVASRQSDVQKLRDGDIFEALLLDNFITLSSVLIRKKTFVELGGFSEDQFGVMDWELWLRYAASGATVAVCRDPLTRYRWHAASISNDFDQRCADRLHVVQRALTWPRGQRVSRSLARRAVASAWGISAWFAARSQPAKAVKWYVRSALCWPWDVGVYKGIAKCCLGRV